MTHTRGKPYHQMTQGKIERYHCSMKNQILLENYYLPGQLEARLAEFVDYYNSRRYHESLNNLTPADMYCNLTRTGSFGLGFSLLRVAFPPRDYPC
jgi:putative transposase